MAKTTVRKLYVVYDGQAETSPDAEVLLITEDEREAIAHAQQHNGTVYTYDVTDAVA